MSRARCSHVATSSYATGFAKALERKVLAEEEPAHQVHREERRALAHLAAVPGHDGVAGDLVPVGVLDAHADIADRLLLRPAARAGDAGDSRRDISLEAVQRAIRQRLGNLRRNRAVLLDELWRDPQDFGLRLVRVGDGPALNVGGRAIEVGQASR